MCLNFPTEKPQLSYCTQENFPFIVKTKTTAVIDVQYTARSLDHPQRDFLSQQEQTKALD